MRRLVLTAVTLVATLLAGCDMLGIDSPEKIAAARENDGKAIGAACRHAARAIEDCYTLNKKADRASVFAGWRDMNDYMRENKIEPVAPMMGAPVARAKTVEDGDAPAADKPAEKTPGKAAKDDGAGKAREAKPRES